MIETGIYPGEDSLPYKVEATSATGAPYDLDGLAAWIEAHQDFYTDKLHTHGAVLFRGFNINSTLQFQRALKVVGGALLDYVDGNSPRTKQSKGVYTSTEYPADQIISLHNELSYCAQWPSKLFFCCITPSETGGSTVLADCRAVYKELPADLVAKFEKGRVRYLRNLHAGNGFGPSWQATFETESKAEVEAFCKQSGMEFSWDDEGGVRVTQIGLGIGVHPVTGEKVWFNQADQFHPSNHPEEYQEALLDMVDGVVEDLPTYAAYGDGAALDEGDLSQVREAFKQHSVFFPWHRGDLLVVDNMLVAHGRDRFTGSRRILVAMS